MIRLTPFIFKLTGGLCVSVSLFAWTPLVTRDMRLDAVGVCFFLVVGAVLYLVGRWLDRKLGDWKPKPIAPPTPGDRRFIKRMLTRQRKVALLFGIFCLAFDALIIFAERASSDSDSPSPSFIGSLFVITLGSLIELLFLSLGILGLYKALTMWSVEKTEIYDLLTNSPETVTGLTRRLYLSATPVGSRGRSLVVELNARDKVFQLPVTAEQFAALMLYIKTHSPQAAYREEEHEVHV